MSVSNTCPRCGARDGIPTTVGEIDAEDGRYFRCRNDACEALWDERDGSWMEPMFHLGAGE